MDLSANVVEQPLMTEDEIYNSMKDLPDFLNYPFPKHWYTKYNIPLLKPLNTKQALEENHAYKMMYAEKQLPPIFIKNPKPCEWLDNIKVPDPDIAEVKVKEFDPNDTALENLQIIS